MFIEYAKRFKVMLNREEGLQRRENSLSKAHLKYSEKLVEIEQRYQEQNEKFSEIKKWLEKEREICETGEKMLAECQAIKAQKEATAKRRLAELIQRDIQLDEIRELKLATNTYVNLKALPERIQGVVIIETNDSSKWRPFSVETIGHSPEELKQIIWGDLENRDEYSKAWEEAVFRPLREMMKQQAQNG